MKHLPVGRELPGLVPGQEILDRMNDYYEIFL